MSSRALDKFFDELAALEMHLTPDALVAFWAQDAEQRQHQLDMMKLERGRETADSLPAYKDYISSPPSNEP